MKQKDLIKEYKSHRNAGILLVLWGLTIANLYFNENYIKPAKYRDLKSKLIRYVDSDKNGLNFKEDYQIKELMGIQDSSKTYVPTFEDWHRGYEKIK